MSNGLDTPALPEGQWPKAARFWPRIGAPLRPAAEDLRFIESLLHDRAGQPLRGLILGVTPEFQRLPWPEGSRINALDRTPEMIEYVWPGNREQAVLGDWRDIPWPEAEFDLVLCDGGLHLLDYPDGQTAMVKELARVLKPGGLALFRLFTPPPAAEPAAAVLEDLMAGRIRDLNCLKLRLGNALQSGPETGVALAEVWRTLRDGTSDWQTLSERIRWPLEQLEAIDAYRDNPAHYHFVSPEQVDALFAEYGFERTARLLPDYVMGGQCPTHVFTKKAGTSS